MSRRSFWASAARQSADTAAVLRPTIVARPLPPVVVQEALAASRRQTFQGGIDLTEDPDVQTLLCRIATARDTADKASRAALRYQEQEAGLKPYQQIVESLAQECQQLEDRRVAFKEDATNSNGIITQGFVNTRSNYHSELQKLISAQGEQDGHHSEAKQEVERLMGLEDALKRDIEMLQQAHAAIGSVAQCGAVSPALLVCPHCPVTSQTPELQQAQEEENAARTAAEAGRAALAEAKDAAQREGAVLEEQLAELRRQAAEQRTAIAVSIQQTMTRSAELVTEVSDLERRAALWERLGEQRQLRLAQVEASASDAETLRDATLAKVNSLHNQYVHAERDLRAAEESLEGAIKKVDIAKFHRRLAGVCPIFASLFVAAWWVFIMPSIGGSFPSV